MFAIALVLASTVKKTKRINNAEDECISSAEQRPLKPGGKCFKQQEE